LYGRSGFIHKTNHREIQMTASYFHKNLICFLYFLILILIFQGCATLRPETDPELDKHALLLARQVKAYNHHILTSKGTALIKLETGTKLETFKIAWAAVFPDKIRITFLISANPVETIISTGEQITFISHTRRHSRHSYKSKDPDMERYIHVPVKMSEMILLLLGRLWSQRIDDAYFDPSNPSLSTIVVKPKEKNSKYSISFNDTNKIHSLAKKDSSGKLKFKITIKEYTIYDSDNIPAKLEIKDNSNRTLNLKIINFISNASIKKSVFKVQTVTK